MAIYDALTCGNTEVTVQNLLYAIQQLSIMDKRHRLSGYALEFQVSKVYDLAHFISFFIITIVNYVITL